MKLNFHQAPGSSVTEVWQSLSEDGGAGSLPHKQNKIHINNVSWSRCYARGVAVFGIMAFICLIFGLLVTGTEQENRFPEGTKLVVKSTRHRVTQDRVITCYYNTPDESTNASHQLLPSGIDPHLCTHINVAFARVVSKQVYLEPHQWEALREVVNLKRANPRLRVLLSVGGAGESDGFSDMVVNHASRKVFIKSVKSILRNYSLDGIDLDWEFPGLHSQQSHLAARERQHFSQLLREIRMEYDREKRDYLLTVALAAPEVIADVSYDIDQIDLYVDFANIMTYDFHYFSKYTPFTGLNSPLFARANEELYLATLNVNYTAGMYTARGLRPDKLVVGVPTYGHTFRLVNAGNTNVGSPAAGVGALGGGGFATYAEVCAFLDAGGAAQRWEAAARVPYGSRGREWASFESPRSVGAKAEYVRARALRGAMIYSLNADDHAGRCGAGAFPLARAVRRALRRPPTHRLRSRELLLPFSSSRRR